MAELVKFSQSFKVCFVPSDVGAGITLLNSSTNPSPMIWSPSWLKMRRSSGLFARKQPRMLRRHKLVTSAQFPLSPVLHVVSRRQERSSVPSQAANQVDLEPQQRRPLPTWVRHKPRSLPKRLLPRRSLQARWKPNLYPASLRSRWSSRPFLPSKGRKLVSPRIRQTPATPLLPMATGPLLRTRRLALG